MVEDDDAVVLDVAQRLHDQVGQALELFAVGADGSSVTQLTRLRQIAASAS